MLVTKTTAKFGGAEKLRASNPGRLLWLEVEEEKQFDGSVEGGDVVEKGIDREPGRFDMADWGPK